MVLGEMSARFAEVLVKELHLLSCRFYFRPFETKIPTKIHLSASSVAFNGVTSIKGDDPESTFLRLSFKPTIA